VTARQATVRAWIVRASDGAETVTTERPTSGRPRDQLLRAEVADHGRTVSIAIRTSEDATGPLVTFEEVDGSTYRAAVVIAWLRWSPGAGPADLWMTWPDRPVGASDTWAVVSDALLLARDPAAGWAVRAFWDALPTVGRRSEQDDRITEIVATAARIGPAATRDGVAAALGFVDPWGGPQPSGQFKRDVAAAGGWTVVLGRAREK
jgi:hypothetical protein